MNSSLPPCSLEPLPTPPQAPQPHQDYEQLLHAVSHDLRAPLRHITSFAPLLRESVQALQAGDGQAAEEVEQFLATIEHAARRMGRMMEALLQVSRAARAPLHLQSVDLLALAREEGLRLAAQRGVMQAVQWHGPESSLPVQGDVQLLRQLLAALLDNALKFSEGSHPICITFTLELEPAQDAAPALLRCGIQDHGVGFDPTRAQPLGGLFQRLHRESEFDGVGAGLALAHTIAQRHGASVHLSAQPNAGCTATLHWPLVP